MLGLIFVFLTLFVISLGFSKKLRDTFVGILSSLAGSLGINGFYDYSYFVEYVLMDTLGLVWLFSYAVLLLVLLFNIVVYNKAIR